MNFFKISRLNIIHYFFVLICMLLIPSAVLHSIVGANERTIFLISVPVLLFLIFLIFGTGMPIITPGLVIFLITTGFFGSVISGASSQLFMALVLAFSIFIGYKLSVLIINPRVLKILTFFLLLLLIGGIVGVLYSLAGGEPQLELQVVYRVSKLYLTTFSLSTIGDLIRPSGIFEEPGSFAMYAVIVTMYNDILGKNQKLNFLIIFMIIFTGSLAGLSMSILYFFTSNSMRSKKNKKIRLIIIFAIVFTVIVSAFSTSNSGTVFELFYSDRISIDDGKLSGDNRSNQIYEFFSLVNKDILLKGSKAIGIQNETDQSSNPFSIVYAYGLIISIPYYFILSYLIYVTFSKGIGRSYSSFGLFLLLLQRPYLYHMSWSILIASLIWLIYLDSKFQLGEGI